MVLALDSDFLQTEPGMVRATRLFSRGRKLRSSHEGAMSRLYVVEPSYMRPAIESAGVAIVETVLTSCSVPTTRSTRCSLVPLATEKINVAVTIRGPVAAVTISHVLNDPAGVGEAVTSEAVNIDPREEALP